MKKEKIIIMIIVVIVILIVGLLFYLYRESHQNQNRNSISEDGIFSTDFIKYSNQVIGEENYMISPYSVEIALSMLREGVSSSTKEELEKAVPKRSIKTISVKDRVNIANALFLKDKFKNDILTSYKKTLTTDYESEIVVDEFRTPDKINKWVDQKTDGKISKILDEISPDFVFGLANAISMEEAWDYPFDEYDTREQDFILKDNKKVRKQMMTKTFEEGISYFEGKDAKGVILPYKTYDPLTGKETEEGEKLEFIAILPENINQYINNFNLDTIKEIDTNHKSASYHTNITVTIPKFEYEYDFTGFKNALFDMGITKIFSGEADFSNMIENHPELYLNTAIHKTYIKLDEKGTKAAAVTYFDVKDGAAAIDDTEHIMITFNRPFIYLIKDQSSNEILFFGTVYEPIWKE